MMAGRGFAAALLLWLALPTAARAQDDANTHWIAGWTQPMMAAAESGDAPPAGDAGRP